MVHAHNRTEPEVDGAAERPLRRDFLTLVSSVAMGGGLLAGYGAFAAMAGRYLYAADEPSVWQYVGLPSEFKSDEARSYTTPSGSRVVIARQSSGETAEAFVALSSTCPHLGCQVHWEAQNKRFFCPCHNGAFDASGRATEGPPAQAKQSLVRFSLKVENGLLYVLVPSRSLSIQEGGTT